MTKPFDSASLVVERLDKNAAIEPLAQLRIAVFRDWPYLYDGSLDYEAEYLAEFLGDPDAVTIVARLGDVCIGMATASPMATQTDAITRPFRLAGIDPAQAFYFGESVLLAAYRGMGIGHRFFDEREKAAREVGARIASFCAVERSDDDARRPEEARSLAPFWNKRGYRPVPGLSTRMTWKEVGMAEPVEHRMRFWMRELDRA